MARFTILNRLGVAVSVTRGWIGPFASTALGTLARVVLSKTLARLAARALPVFERQLGRPLNVIRRDGQTVLKCRECPGRLVQHDISAQPVDSEFA
ncbi:MAG TPA: hypothetical protein VGX76_09875, partial [Pirellulales bacterium]|nr:hypothetical protein [Pirellulales bacterium]